MLQKLFFDIDDTLYSTSDFAYNARKNSIDALVEIGVDVEPDRLFEELQEVIDEFSSNYPYHYDKLLLRLPDEAHDHINDTVAVAAAVISYHKTKEHQLSPFPDAKRFLDCLTASSIPEKPGIITEGLDVKQAEKLLRLDLYRYLDPMAIYISDQVGISKPNPKLFETALEGSGVSPENAMYVGDRPLGDIDPANTVGMHTVHLNKNTQHTDQEGKTEPDYAISDFKQLVKILRENFQVEIPSY